MKLDKLQEAYDEMFDFIAGMPSGLDGFESDFDAAYKELLEAKSADVAPVVHGRWIEENTAYGIYKCSVCGTTDGDCSDYYGAHDVKGQHYCPYCGAKMDLEEEDKWIV